MAVSLATHEKIALYRKRLGISQSELGRRVNDSQSTVSDYETGAKIINIDRLERYAIALQVDVRIFYD